MKYVTNIDSSNEALKFIDFRISDNKYRGSSSSQHNRYTMSQIITILSLFNKYSPDCSLMTIRTADISKRPNNTKDEEVYALFCNEAKTHAGIGTQDAMRKNLFVDLHRMGLIERYDVNKKPTNPFSKQSIKYASLTYQGLKLIEAVTVLDKYFIFSKAIDKLLGGYIDIILSIFRDPEYHIDHISIYEFMFFVSAIGTATTYNISTGEAVGLIKEYRNLSTIQRRAVIEELKLKLRPLNYSGTKTQQRDFRNWWNKIEQIFYILNQTVYFERRGEQLVSRDRIDNITGEIVATQLNRSLDEKFQYFVKHDIEKIKGFELHHVVPLSWSESIQQFKLFDKWENMVYIDAFSHAKITQNRNRNVIMSANMNDIILKDFGDNEVYLKEVDNIAYNIDKKEDMLKYNSELLKTTS